VEVKIGVQNAPREIALESTQSADEISDLVSEALGSEGGMLSLVDDKGRRVLVPASKIAYVELGEPQERRVGFGAM
jgi:Protein of unknown function (DUF3107)